LGQWSSCTDTCGGTRFRATLCTCLNPCVCNTTSTVRTGIAGEHDEQPGRCECMEDHPHREDDYGHGYYDDGYLRRDNEEWQSKTNTSGLECQGKQPIEEGNCPTNMSDPNCCSFGVWGSWSSCTQICGGGTMWRRQLCVCGSDVDCSTTQDTNDALCKGIPNQESETCNTVACQAGVNPFTDTQGCSFQGVGSVTQCNASCGGGYNFSQPLCECGIFFNDFTSSCDVTHCAGIPPVVISLCNNNTCSSTTSYITVPGLCTWVVQMVTKSQNITTCICGSAPADPINCQQPVQINGVTLKPQAMVTASSVAENAADSPSIGYYIPALPVAVLAVAIVVMVGVGLGVSKLLVLKAEERV